MRWSRTSRLLDLVALFAVAYCWYFLLRGCHPMVTQQHWGSIVPALLLQAWILRDGISLGCPSIPRFAGLRTLRLSPKQQIFEVCSQLLCRDSRILAETRHIGSVSNVEKSFECSSRPWVSSDNTSIHHCMSTRARVVTSIVFLLTTRDFHHQTNAGPTAAPL